MAAAITLEQYLDTWAASDRDANFKAEVACYTVADPLPTIETLSRNTGIPVGCLVRFVLVKYAASGSEALMAIGPIVLQQMQQQVEKAEAAGTAEARLEAYDALRQIVEWLRRGI
jgi:hypothetical protein